MTALEFDIYRIVEKLQEKMGCASRLEICAALDHVQHGSPMDVFRAVDFVRPILGRMLASGALTLVPGGNYAYKTGFDLLPAISRRI